MFRRSTEDDRGYRRDRNYEPSRSTSDRRDERPQTGGLNTRSYSSADARKNEYTRMDASGRRGESFGRASDRRSDRPSSSLNYSRGDSRPMDTKRKESESRLSLSQLMPLPKTTPVDHKEKCPFTVRFFLKQGDPHDPKDFEDMDKLPLDEISVMCWTDVSLRYISDLLRAQRADIRTAILTFTIIYRDLRSKALGARTVARISPIRPGPSDSKTFEEMRYRVGDYISVAASRPERKPRRDERDHRDNRDQRDSRRDRL